MRIGIDARLFRTSTGGIGRYSQNLIKELLKIDHENQYVLFFTPEDKKDFENWVIENSLKIENWNLKIIIADISHYSIAEQTKFSKIIAGQNVDLMLFLNFNVPLNYKGKFIVVIHDLTLFFYPETAKKTSAIKRLAFRHVIKKACQRAQKVIAVSEHTKKDIINYFKIEPSKIVTIYEAADDKNLKTQNSNLEVIEDNLSEKYAINHRPVVLYVGQFRPHKNIVNLVKAFEILKKDGFPGKLVLIGKRNPGYQELVKTIDNSPQKLDIVEPGFVSNEELASWYKLAKVFVFPSLYEGFGLPGLEAMMAGLPVASSRATSLSEVYQDGALYFDPKNPEDIAEKIKMVLNDDKLRERLVMRGSQVAAKYSWKKTAENTLKIINSFRG